jgi:hypothetical protein
MKLQSTKVFALMAVAGFLGGCTGKMVSDSELVDRTSFALGLNPTDFTISERRSSPLKANYTVVTKTGHRYWCYVGISMGVTSDAMCNEAPGSKGKTDAPKPKCNDLHKAAGRCK